MAESQFQKQRFGHLIPGSKAPKVETHYSEPESSENIHDVEDPEFLKIIEREIYDLTIKEAEFEGLKEATDSDDSVDGREKVEKLDLGGESDGYLGERQRNGSQRWSKFPMRPDAEDCAYYMKTGSCKYGPSCKFNHPPRRSNQLAKEWTKLKDESTGSVALSECKYYRTSGGCKYGKDCKYPHGPDKKATSQELNFLGLPIRPGEKECPYYKRTGKCKYGSTCKFHHPDPNSVARNEVSSGYGNGNMLASSQSSTGTSSWSLPQPFNETSPYGTAIYPSNHSSTTSIPKWNGYQAGSGHTSERGLPLPPAFSVTEPPSWVNFGKQHPHDSLIDEFPERPGEPECKFFMHTGDCKFRSSCKFHHPKTRSFNPRQGFFALNDKGLPLRPDQPICTHYHRYGICKYGPACKYNHPSHYSTSPPFGNS